METKTKMIQHHFGAICALVGAGIVFKDANEKKYPDSLGLRHFLCSSEAYAKSIHFTPNKEAGRY